MPSGIWIDCDSEKKDALPNPHLNIVLQSLMLSSKITTFKDRVGSSQFQLMAASGLDFSCVRYKGDRAANSWTCAYPIYLSTLQGTAGHVQALHL